MPDMPNVTCVAIFGEPAYDAVRQGGGALQSSWFDINLLCHKDKLPHGQQVGPNWRGKDGRNKLLGTFNLMASTTLKRSLETMAKSDMDDIRGYP